MDSYLKAIDAAGRRDLARPLLRVLQRIQNSQWQSTKWTGKLDVGDWSMGDRLTAYRAAFQLFCSAETLHRWQDEAVATGYFEEGYQAAQLWKSDWEFYNGSQFAEFAQDVMNQEESGLVAWASGDADAMSTTEGDEP